MRASHRFAASLVASVLILSSAVGDDWPMFGRDHTHNAVSPEKGAPSDWHLLGAAKRTVGDKVVETFADAQNIAWTARVGSRGIGGPVVAGGLVWVGTDNSYPRDPNDFVPRKDGKKEPTDKSVLLCFRETDGRFLWQLAVPRLGAGVSITQDWSGRGMGSTPLVEGDRLWLITNRAEAVCFDIGPLRRSTGVPVEVWKVDLRKQFGVVPLSALMANGFAASVAADQDRLYVVTGNGLDENHEKVVAPEAPSLVCLNKATGKAIWTDNSPGTAILLYQFSSPLVATVKGRAMCVVGQGDGWLRAFDAATGKLVWKCDLNAKDAKWVRGSNRTTRFAFAATPVLHEDRVYVGMGTDPEHISGVGWLSCIDPTKHGDVSPELEVSPGKGKPNPNSAVVWRYGGPEKDPAKAGRDAVFGLTMGNCTIHDGLCYACDQEGFLHCLDAATGMRYWTYDTKAEVWGSPLWVDGNVYVATSDGDLWVIAHGREKKIISKVDVEKAMHTGPVFANGTLFILTDSTLFAVRQPK